MTGVGGMLSLMLVQRTISFRPQRWQHTKFASGAASSWMRQDDGLPAAHHPAERLCQFPVDIAFDDHRHQLQSLIARAAPAGVKIKKKRLPRSSLAWSMNSRRLHMPEYANTQTHRLREVAKS